MLSLVASEAFGIHFFGSRLGRVENLGDVSAAIDVRFTGPVTTFAGYPALTVRFRQLGMRIRNEFLANLFVAGGAGFLPYIVSRKPILTGFYARGPGFL